MDGGKTMNLKEIKEKRYPVEDFGGVRIDWLIHRVEKLEELLRLARETLTI